MKYLSVGPLSDTLHQGVSSQPMNTESVTNKSKFEDWKTEQATKQIL